MMVLACIMAILDSLLVVARLDNRHSTLEHGVSPRHPSSPHQHYDYDLPHPKYHWDY